MAETDAVVRTTLRVPGNWSHPGELIERMPAGFRLTPEALILPDDSEIEFTPMPPDGQFPEIFKSSCRQPAAADELEIVDNYTVNVGLTGPGVVKSVLGEDIAPEELGGPKVHAASGVTDLAVADETAALRTAVRLLSYLPDNNFSMSPFQETSDPLDRKTWEINTLLKKAFNSPTGFNTPFDVSIIIQQICDHGDYFEIQPERAREAITAFGRLGGNVVGFVANNSSVSCSWKNSLSRYNGLRPERLSSTMAGP